MRPPREKKRISAKSVLTDLKANISDEDLMSKYDLSTEGLRSLFKKMVEAGLLRQEELDRRSSLRSRTESLRRAVVEADISKPSPPQTVPVHLGPKSARVQAEPVPPYFCPACNFPEEEPLAVCPKCGIAREKSIARMSGAPNAKEGEQYLGEKKPDIVDNRGKSVRKAEFRTPAQDQEQARLAKIMTDKAGASRETGIAVEATPRSETRSTPLEAEPQSVFIRALKVVVPASGAAGVIFDLASPIASFAAYFAISGLIVTVFSGMIWYRRQRRWALEQLEKAGSSSETPLFGLAEAMTWLRKALKDLKSLKELEEFTPDLKEYRNVLKIHRWSVAFAFSLVATLVMAGVFGAQVISGDKKRGFLASKISAVARLQESLFRIESDVKEIKTTTRDIRKTTGIIAGDTKEIKGDTKRILFSVQEISRGFEALDKKGGIVSNPETPQEWYHNARMYELNADFGKAREAYNKYLTFKLDFVDPYMSYLKMVKAQEGREGAKETFGYLVSKQYTLAAKLGQILLGSRDERIKQLQELAKSHPDYGPVCYYLGNEYSEETVGTQTIADKREEKKYLTCVTKAQSQGNFYKYFLDKNFADGLISEVDRRLKKLEIVSDDRLENPVKVRFVPVRKHSYLQPEWWVSLSFADSDLVKEILYHFDGESTFRSTGHAPQENSKTGLALPYNEIPLERRDATKLYVKYVDVKGRENGPFVFDFNPDFAMLEWAKYALKDSNGRVKIEPDRITMSRYVLDFGPYLDFHDDHKYFVKAVHYSTHSASVDKTLRLPTAFKMPNRAAGEEEPRLVVAVPPGTNAAYVKAEFIDGTESEVFKIPHPFPTRNGSAQKRQNSSDKP